MSYSSTVAAFVKPVITLTALQSSVVGFIDSTVFGIASSPRQTGMTFALHSHLIFELASASDTLVLVVFPKISMMRQAISEMNQFMSVLGANRMCGDIKCDQQHAYIKNKTTGVTIEFSGIDNLHEHRMRGRKINHVIFADFDGYGRYARDVQEKLTFIMPCLSYNDSDYKIHMIGTDGNSYVSNAHDQSSIMYAAMNGKSQFKFWNYQLSTMVDDLLAL